MTMMLHTDFGNPLIPFVTMQRPVLDAIAAAWMARGARWMSVHEIDSKSSDDAGASLAVWSSGAIPAADNEVISAPLIMERSAVGLLRVGICLDDATSAQIQADASMLSHLLGVESDMDDMTLELIESQDRLLALYRLTRSLTGQINPDAIMATLAREAVKLVDTRAAVLLLNDVQGWHITAHPEDAVDIATILAMFQNLEAVSEGHLCGDGCQDGELYALPIDLSDGTPAALILVDKPGGFTSPDLKLARAIVDTASVHLENARLHQTLVRKAETDAELKIAANIQRGLLPTTLPDVPGLSLHGGSLQARSVGGDFYDANYHDGGVLSFMVGDVTGKGFSAALMMAVTRTSIRSRAELNLDRMEAGAVFTRANADLYDDYSRVNMFTTAFIGRYDPETRMLCYSNAGHSPVIYCPAGGEAEMLVANDIPLGILPDTNYSEIVLPLNEGDLLVVATDGFSEARNAAGELFGYDRLKALITTLAALDAPAMGAALFDAVDEFGGETKQDDDQTLFVLKCK